MVYANNFNKETNLFFITAAVDLFLQGLHAFEGLFAVNAVDKHKSVCKTEVVPRELLTVTQSSSVIKPHLFSSAAVRLHRPYVNVLQCLHGFRTWQWSSVWIWSVVGQFGS